MLSRSNFSLNALIVKFRNDIMLKKDILLSSYNTDGFSFGNGARFREIQTVRIVFTFSRYNSSCTYVYVGRKKKEKGGKERERNARATHFEVTSIEYLDSTTLNWNYRR